MYYKINNSDQVTLTLDREEINCISVLLCAGVCDIHENSFYYERLDYYRSLRDIVCDARDELYVYDNPDFMEGDKS